MHLHTRARVCGRDGLERDGNMKTKYDMGSTVLVPCEVKEINIDKKGIVYTVLPAGYTSNLLNMKEYEIWGSTSGDKIGASENYNDGWIPVSERLPEDDTYILLSFSNYTLPDIGRYEEDAEGGAFYPGDDDRSYSSYGLFVNAWQPLPESYQQKKVSEYS